MIYDIIQHVHLALLPSCLLIHMPIFLISGCVEDIRCSHPSSLALQTECNAVLQDLFQLSSILHQFIQQYSDNAVQLEDSFNCPKRTVQCLVTWTGARGRPAYIVSRAQLETFIELGFNYSTIARMIGVSKRTLLRRRVEYSLPVGVTFTDITDGDLDVAVRGILQVCSGIGECIELSDTRA